MPDDIPQQDPAPPLSREDLRRRLREKIRNKGHHRNAQDGAGPQLAQRMKSDPTTTMLQMGLDDPELLSQAKHIVQNPQAFLKSAAASLREIDQTEKGSEPSSSRPDDKGSDTDEEEAPPLEGS